MAGAVDVNALKDRATKVVKSFSGPQMAIIGLLAVVALIGGMAFVKWASAPSYSVLFSNLDPKDASAITEQLKSDGVAFKLGGDGTSIMVPSSKVYQERIALSAAGLPKGNAVGYELLDKEGLTTSEFRQQVDYQRALEGELTRTLLAVDGVADATVHLAIPKDSVFTENKDKPRASVLLKTNGGLSDDAVQSIVHLVASSVPGLDPSEVTVADADGKVLSSSDVASGAVQGRQLQLRQQYENQLSANANSMLTQVLGAGKAVVRVSADLNFDEIERQTDSYDPNKSALLRDKTTTETFKGNGNPPEGVVGVAGGPTQTPTNSDYSKSDGSHEFGVDHTVESVKQAPGQVKRLSVAVLLDGSARPVPSQATVETAISNALGLDRNRGDSISVDTLRFDKSLSTAAKAAQKKAAGQASATQTMSLIRTVLGGLLLLAVLFFLFRGLKPRAETIELPEAGPGSIAAAMAAAQQPAGALAAPGIDLTDAAAGGVPAGTVAAGLAGLGHGLPLPDGDPGAAVPIPVPVGGPNPEADLLRLIDQQPEEVAVLLRSWIADRRS